MTYELVMPFVTVESAGGPHDDEAYIAGYECGVIDSALERTSDSTWERTVHTANLSQLDLIAMRRGFTLTTHGLSDGWMRVRFTRA